MRTFASIAVLGLLTACTAVPVVDDQGNPVIDPETGEPKTTQEFDGEKAGEAVTAVGTFLPPPWDLIATGIGGIVAGVAGQRAASRRGKASAPAEADPAEVAG